MKNKIIGFLLILLILVGVPMINLNKSEVTKAVSAIVTPKGNEIKLIAQKTARTVNKDYCEEAVKAIIIILNSNYKCDKSMFSEDTNAEKLDNYSKIEKLTEKMSGKRIKINKKAVAVPYFKYSAGYTQPSKKYPYIKSAASPWDSKQNEGNTVGVSLNGINELCKKGLDYKEALRWYLNAEI